MKIDKFKMYLFFKLKEYQEDLKFSDIEIINDNNETNKEKIDSNRIHETDHEEV